jgi:cytochrome b involved in lipid metabolism
MKLKKITLGVFIIFVCSLAGLALYSEYTSKSSTNIANNSILPVSNIGEIPASTGNITLTLPEIAKHNTRADCYLIMKDSVYSVAGFIDKHPGGAMKILDMCGKEATTIFTAIHSNFAWNLLKDFYIGKVGDSINIESATAEVKTRVEANPDIKTLKAGDDDEEDEEDEIEYEKD